MADFRHETERLILRDWREEDRDPFAAINADPEVMRYFRSVMSRAQSDALVDRISQHFDARGFGLFALEQKSDGAFIGFTGLSSAPAGTLVDGDIEIGWRLARAHWRRGYAFEAASACIDFFWRSTDFERLVSFTSDANLPSRSLMQKLGLKRRPDLDFDHPAIPHDHRLCHQVVYAAVRNETAHG